MFTSQLFSGKDSPANFSYLCQAALQNLPGHRMRFDYTDGDADQEAAFYILRHTACAAALTENGFMDCHRSCDYLLSNEGKVKEEIKKASTLVQRYGVERSGLVPGTFPLHSKNPVTHKGCRGLFCSIIREFNGLGLE